MQRSRFYIKILAIIQVTTYALTQGSDVGYQHVVNHLPRSGERGYGRSFVNVCIITNQPWILNVLRTILVNPARHGKTLVRDDIKLITRDPTHTLIDYHMSWFEIVRI